MNKPTLLIASIGLLGAFAGTPALAASADDHHGRHAAAKHSRSGYDHRMQPVATSAAAGEPGYGWRYFSDPKGHRAVVISPDGAYYYSHGKGLRLVAETGATDTAA